MPDEAPRSMTPDEVAEVKALAHRATPGPWLERRHSELPLPSFVQAKRLDAAHPYDIEILGEDTTLYPTREADVVFIAAARTAIPRLIATVEALWERERVLLERLRLLDRIIVDHHSASVLRDEHDVCPVCDAEGGVAFFVETGRLLRDRRLSTSQTGGENA